MTLRTRFWLLAGLRWLPTGFIIPVGRAAAARARADDRGVRRGRRDPGHSWCCCSSCRPAGSPTRSAASPSSSRRRSSRWRPTSPHALAQVALAFVLASASERGLPRARQRPAQCVVRRRGPRGRPTIDEPQRRSWLAACPATRASWALDRHRGGPLGPVHRLGAAGPRGLADRCRTGSRHGLACLQIVVARLIMHEDRSARVAGVVRSMRAPRRGVVLRRRAAAVALAGAAGPRGGRAVLGLRHDRLRVVHADPAVRAADRPRSGRSSHGAGHRRSMGRLGAGRRDGAAAPASAGAWSASRSRCESSRAPRSWRWGWRRGPIGLIVGPLRDVRRALRGRRDLRDAAARAGRQREPGDRAVAGVHGDAAGRLARCDHARRHRHQAARPGSRSSSAASCWRSPRRCSWYGSRSAGRRQVVATTLVPLSVEEQAQQDAEGTRGHEDVADGHEVHAADGVLDREGQDRAEGEKDDGSTDVHGLKPFVGGQPSRP